MFSTLSVRMFLIMAAITLAGLGVLAWIVVRIYAQDLEDETVRGALLLADTVRKSTRYSMLKNQKEDVYQIAETVGTQPGIERIRIFNKEGRITFSTDSEESGAVVDKAAEACNQCHTGNDEPISQLAGMEGTRVFDSPDKHRVLGLTAPIYNEPSCGVVGCHATPAEQTVLGILDIHTSLDRIDRAVQNRNGQFLLLTYVLMLLIATTCGISIWRFVHIPVKTLIRGTRHIAQGNLDHRISNSSRSEIGLLAESFNTMANDLGQARNELTDWAQTLEQRVEEKTETLRQAQAKLTQSVKLASLGSLSAVVAHEINNPLSGVLTYTKLVRRIVGTELSSSQVEDLHQYLGSMESELARCGRIVSNLLAFSRQSTIVVGETDLNAILEKTLFLLGHKLELQGITLVKDFSPDLPTVVCDSDQIQQAILAILINAVEAMPEGGELNVSSKLVAGQDTECGWVKLIVRDTGGGIPEDVLPRLFEPFFTTKENRKGVGLGLSVVYGIVKHHQGRISVDSKVGEGTTFVVELPEMAPDEPGILDAASESSSSSTAIGETGR